MDELELVRLHEDGERLVLAARDGAQATLPITDALRAALRGDRPRMESIRAQEESSLRPREIQARLRAGETCEQLAEASGLPIEHVRRFEYPVISEREHAIARVRAKPLVTDDDVATTLGEISDERLRSRGVRPDDATWTATREGTHPWFVRVEFEAGDRIRSASWTLEPRGGFVTALDDEARWLGQPEDDGPAYAGVSAPVSALPAPPEPDDTDLLLDNLSERRGQRPGRRPSPDAELPGFAELDAADDERTAEPDEDSPAQAAVVDIGARRNGPRATMPPVTAPGTPATMEWDGPSRWEISAPTAESAEAPTEPPAAPEPASGPAPEPAPDPVPEPAPEPVAAKRPTKRNRKSRAQVPSWDEIVFGSRPEV